MTDQAAGRTEKDPGGVPEPRTGGPGTWSSDPVSGAKVCALRLDTVHLVHTGMAAGWDPGLVEEYFAEAPLEFRPREGGAGAPGEGAEPAAVDVEPPAAVRGWLEALRYGHAEMWPGAEELGTTACAALADSLWVLARGTHVITIRCEAGDFAAEQIQGLEGGRLWRLNRRAPWRVDVSLPDGLAVLWTARWRPALTLVPAPTGTGVEEAGAATGGEPPSPEADPGAVSAPESAAGADAPASPGVAPGVAPGETPLGRPPIWRRRPALPAALRPYRREVRWAGWALAAGIVLLGAWSAVPKAPVAGAWERFSDFCAGRYRVYVTTTPPGAALRVDGHDAGVVAPGWLALREGKHRVEAGLGRYGATAFEVNGKRGGRGVGHGAILGRLSVGCADTSVTLFAFLDGQPVGRVPVRIDSVPAGVRQLSFQGRDVRPWTEEIGVAAGRTTQVLARPEKVPDHGVVLARAYRVGTEGLRDLPGAAVYVDGEWKASTPARLELPRGLHTVRLAAGGVDSPVQLLRVEGGQELYATAEFGRSPEPVVWQELLGAASIAQPPVVRARLRSPMPIRVSEMRLHFGAGDGDFQRLPMSLRAGDVEVVADAALPLAGLAPGTQVRYFVTVKSDEGEEFVGEMKRVRLVR